MFFDIRHPAIFISIHPPHAGRDRGTSPPGGPDPNFNPPSPCGEGLNSRKSPRIVASFQSTLPMRGGTRYRFGRTPPERFQSTLPMRGGTDTGKGYVMDRLFQSTLPMRGGTRSSPPAGQDRPISIHPPHAGRDENTLRHILTKNHFNPPSPCGEGRRYRSKNIQKISFQSTLPMRGGTTYAVDHSMVNGISIHPPHAGRDGPHKSHCLPIRYFNPPSPCGEGHLWNRTMETRADISIHPPHAGRDAMIV